MRAGSGPLVKDFTEDMGVVRFTPSQGWTRQRMNEEWCWDNVIWVRGVRRARNGMELSADPTEPELGSGPVQSGRRQRPALW